MRSRRHSGSSSRSGRSSSSGHAAAWSRRSRAYASASFPGRSGTTPRPIPTSNASRANGSASSRRLPRPRCSSGTATRPCSPLWRSRPHRSRSSRSRSGTWPGPRSARSRSRSVAGRRGPPRCRTSAIPSSPSGSAASRAWCARRQSSGSRTSLSGTSVTSRTRRRSGSSFRMPFSRSTTCSTVSSGLSRGWSSDPSRCAGISSRATGCSSASAFCSLSWPRASDATRRTASSRGTQCGPGTRSRTSARWSRPTPRSRGCSRPTRSPTRSTFALTPVTSMPCSSDSAHSPGRRNRSMPEAALHVGSGKVRELYALDDDRLLLVASDRISTFDVVLPTEIPDKGRVLAGLSAFWFARTGDICANHLLELRPDGRSLECRRLEMLPIECVVRGYLAGSGWKDYLATGAVSGHRLPDGLVESDRLPEPIFTPATKAQTGHDENITRDEAAELVGASRLAEVEAIALALYGFAADYAAERGIIIADTKFELGTDAEGRLVLGDEALTPDSSRFWPADSYEAGRSQPSFDKQFVRDYCETVGWDKRDPGPELPQEVVAGTRARYVEAFERLAELPFDRYLREPERVLR